MLTAYAAHATLPPNAILPYRRAVCRAPLGHERGCQYAQTLSTQLLNHTVVLRNYYTDAALKYDANGTLLTKGTSGFGVSDGRLFVERVDLTPEALALVGQHTVSVYQ